MSLSKRPVKCGVVILAAGMGKRMRSALPKVLHQAAGKPLLFHVLNQVRQAIPAAPVALVVGHGKEQVEAYVRKESLFKSMDITFILQEEQKGTGHAARCAMDSSWGEKRVQEDCPILVLPGDLPLLSQGLIQEMVTALRKTEVLRLLTCMLRDPFGYGRVVRKGLRGAVLRIVEEKDASPKEKRISEVATSIYFFQSSFLKKSLQNLSNQNSQGEYYLTDVIELANRAKKKIALLTWNDSEDLRGVNDRWELAQAGDLLNQRKIRSLALKGVTLISPSQTRIDATVEVEQDVVIHSGVILSGDTRIASHCTIGPNVILTDVEVGEYVQIKAGTVAEKSRIGGFSQVGPYAHLRPDSEVDLSCKIGNFVELKKTKVGKHSSIAHLSYLGDAEVGQNVNIGCGFVTCNFDGRVIEGERKHRTVIEDDVFLGSDCQAVAPVRIGRGAYIASGSTITEDVPPGDLAIARSRQVNKPGYAQKLKK